MRRYARSDWITSGVVGTLVLGQTVVAEFRDSVLPTVFRSQGVSLEDLWVFGLIGIPGWVKWMWSPFVDQYTSERFGRRKTWLLACSLAASAIFLVMLTVEPSADSLGAVVMLMVLFSLVMATQDIANDAYTVEQLTDRNRPLGVAMILAASNVAVLIAIAGLSLVFAKFGWKVTIIAAAAAFLAFTLPAIIRREIRPPYLPPIGQHSRSDILAMLRRGETPWVFAMIVGSTFYWKWSWVMFGPFLLDRGMTLSETGIALGSAVLPANLLAVVIGERILSRLGPIGTARVGVAASVALAGVWVAFAVWPEMDVPTAIIFVSLNDFLAYPMGMLVTAMRFRWAAGDQAGTDYSVQSSVNAIALSSVTFVAAPLAHHVGWTAYFTLGGVFLIFFGIVCPWIVRNAEAHFTRRVPTSVVDPPEPMLMPVAGVSL